MIVMDLKVNNFYAFSNFNLNMSYPKKIIGSSIKEENIKNRPNFRYKKVNIIMGSNATGKTSIGKMMMRIFNFIRTKNYEGLVQRIRDKSIDATYSIDIVIEEEKENKYSLYRIETKITSSGKEKYDTSNILVTVKTANITKSDSYETCVKKLKPLNEEPENTIYIQELDKINDNLGWRFEYPDNELSFDIKEMDQNCLEVLNLTLKTLDPSIECVEPIPKIEDSYVIRMGKQEIIVQDGKILNEEVLSSGTKSGINIAFMVAAIKSGKNGFYYCDEKFSYINSDIEKAYLSLMCELLKNNEQLFFTTHNLDILEMDFPKHSYVFLRKDITNMECPIQVEYASDYLKRNTDLLRRAVENDLFSISPNLENIYAIAKIDECEK